MTVDRYASLDELKASKREGVDYQVIAFNRKSPVTVISPHGGFIEPGTSAVAYALAGRTYNLFDFQGLIAGADEEFHVTSRNFRDPILDQLLAQSQIAISIHGLGTESNDLIWLGGLNKTLKEGVRLSLENAGFMVNANPPRYKGEHKQNVVNLAQRQGVQLEFSDIFRNQLFAGAAFSLTGKGVRKTEIFLTFIKSLKRAIRKYCAIAST